MPHHPKKVHPAVPAAARKSQAYYEAKELGQKQKATQRFSASFKYVNKQQKLPVMAEWTKHRLRVDSSWLSCLPSVTQVNLNLTKGFQFQKFQRERKEGKSRERN